MYIHRGKRVVYLAHPRTASVATGKSLQQVGFEPIGGLRETHHTALLDEKSPVSVSNRSEWTAITTVRNHWDAAISWMFKWLRHAPPRPNWDVRDFHFWLNHSRWVQKDSLWWPHSNDADIIWRYESLPKDIAQTFTTLDIPVPDLIIDNVTEARGQRDYHEFYNPATRDYIGNRFKDEIDRFHYRY